MKLKRFEVGKSKNQFYYEQGRPSKVASIIEKQKVTTKMSVLKKSISFILAAKLLFKED